MCMQIWVALDLLHVDSPTTISLTTPTTCYQPLYYPSYRVLPTTPTPTYYPYYPYYLPPTYSTYPYYPCYLLLLLLPLGTTPNYPSERFMYRVYVFSMCCVSIVYGIHVFLRACIGAWIVFFLDVS